jgi:hypothetical protein
MNRRICPTHLRSTKKIHPRSPTKKTQKKMQEEEFCAEAFEEDPERKLSDVQTGCFIRFSKRRSHAPAGR